jgi:hypothetical protein
MENHENEPWQLAGMESFENEPDYENVPLLNQYICCIMQ